MTSGLMKSSRTRNKLYKKSIGHNKSHIYYKTYIQYRNAHNKLKRYARYSYYRNLLEKHQSDIRKTWNIMNSVIGRTRDKSSIPDTFMINNKSESSQQIIADSFCHYFTNIGKQFADAITPSKHSFESYLKLERNSHSMFLNPTDPSEIFKIIKSFKMKKSTGHDGISIVLLKSLGESVCKPLSELINMSLIQGIVPDAMKIAKVIPIYKAKNKELFTNYRPISLLPVISKILERVVHCRLYSFLTRYNILYDSQYGFRNKHSTINAITEFTNDIMSSFDMKHTSLAVYLDLSKAFDTIDHSILLKKMEHYGIRGITLEWFKSYLNQRVQYVTYKSTNSKSLNIPCGVPQGSVLGPLLFILYSNDIPNSLKYSKSILFADDTTVYISGEDVTDLFRCLNHDLSKLNDWFKANKLSLNVNKTNYILFNKNTAVLPPDVCLYIGTDKLEQVRCTKFLGLHIDDHLEWDIHINHCKSKVSSGIHAMNMAKNILSGKHLRIIYNSLVHPYLSYGNLLWGNSYKKYINKLEILQKKAIRCMSKATYNEHSSPLFKRNKITKFKDIHSSQLGQLMYDFVNNNLPPPLMDLYTRNSEIHQHDTRHNIDIHLPKVNFDIVRRSFIFKGPDLWIKLDPSIKCSNTRTSFKYKLRHKLLSAY